MKHFTRLVLVVAMMALLGSVVHAGSMWIDPAMPTQLDVSVGATVTYDIYFHNDIENELYVAGYEFLLPFDDTELEFIDPGNSPVPPFGPLPLPNSDAFIDAFPDTSTAGQVRVWALLGTGYEASGAGDLLLFSLEFEVIADPPPGDFVTDCYLVEQTEENPYGIAAFWYYDEEEEKSYDKTYKFNGAEGADVGIPEPTTTALLGIGLLGALLRKRS